MPSVSRDGVRLSFEQSGRGEPALVFVPGWCCDASFYAPQVERFSRSHAVTTVELRGCGNSDRPTVGYDIPNLAEQLSTGRPGGTGHPHRVPSTSIVSLRRPHSPATTISLPAGTRQMPMVLATWSSA